MLGITIKTVWAVQIPTVDITARRVMSAKRRARAIRPAVRWRQLQMPTVMRIAI